MKTDTEILLTQAQNPSTKVAIQVAIVQADRQQSSDFIQDNWHFIYYSLESLSFSIIENPEVVDAVFVSPDSDLSQMRKLGDLLNAHCIPFILYSSKFDESVRAKALEMKVDDYLLGSFNELMLKRISFIRKTKLRKNTKNSTGPLARIELMQSIKIWRLKRLSDIILSSLALVALSPIILLIAITVKLESRGPIFYISKRAGSGYKIFNFYKFRSMRANADKELKDLAHLNQYTEDGTEAVFFKIKDDPRVTPFGMFLRNTSLDELPQLFNVLKGDMSLVGNRPLPLYEAERLTKDQIAWRFLAPAGITGLWQVTKRGNKEMSLEERIHLDMEYAMKNSFILDMKIIFATFPALFQKEKV
jgi:lipopolysaccharide/colanic/teichoic acid biosynthesis glycosyltransferase